MRRSRTSTALCQRNMLASEVIGRSRESAPVGGGRWDLGAEPEVPACWGLAGGLGGTPLAISDYSGTFVRISAGILMAPRRLGASRLDLVCAWPSATRSHAALKKWCQRAATTAQVNSIAAQSARPARAFSASTGPQRHHTSRNSHPLQHHRRDWRQTSAGIRMGTAMGPGVILWIQRPCLTTVPYNAVMMTSHHPFWIPQTRCSLKSVARELTRVINFVWWGAILGIRRGRSACGIDRASISVGVP